MDAKRIIIFIVLLVALFFAGQRACQEWQKYHPSAPPPTATPAPGAE